MSTELVNSPFENVIDQVEESAKAAIDTWLSSVQAPAWVGKLVSGLIYLTIAEQQHDVSEIKAAIADVVRTIPETID